MAGEINDGVTPFTMWQKQTGSERDCLIRQIAGGDIPHQPDFQCANYCGIYTKNEKGDLYAASGKSVIKTCLFFDRESSVQGAGDVGATGSPQ